MVLSRWRKTDREGKEVTSVGRLFQTVAPATANERVPIVVQRTRGTSRRLVDVYDERGPDRRAQVTQRPEVLRDDQVNVRSHRNSGVKHDAKIANNGSWWDDDVTDG